MRIAVLGVGHGEKPARATSAPRPAQSDGRRITKGKEPHGTAVERLHQENMINFDNLPT